MVEGTAAVFAATGTEDGTEGVTVAAVDTLEELEEIGEVPTDATPPAVAMAGADGDEDKDKDVDTVEEAALVEPRLIAVNTEVGAAADEAPNALPKTGVDEEPEPEPEPKTGKPELPNVAPPVNPPNAAPAPAPAPKAP